MLLALLLPRRGVVRCIGIDLVRVLAVMYVGCTTTCCSSRTCWIITSNRLAPASAELAQRKQASRCMQPCSIRKAALEVLITILDPPC